MRMVKRNRGLGMLSAAAGGMLALVHVASASADVTTEQPGSIVVWPKVVWDGTRDTVIQLANTGNPLVYAHCFYVNAAPRINPCAPPSATNPPGWVETDFWIWLTRQQPTHWVVSTGRRTNTDSPPGFSPGLIPPVPMCFQGELKCVQVDDSGAPSTGNKLKGEATLRSVAGDVSKYNAIALLGNPGASGLDIGNELELTLTEGNPDGEYSACPDLLLFNHFAYGAPDLALAIGPDNIGVCNSSCSAASANPAMECRTHLECGCPANDPACCRNDCGVTTNLTLVPCSQDFETQTPARSTIQFQVYNEFEQPFSASTTINCWLDAPLNTLGTSIQQPTNNPFTFNVLGTISAFTRVHPIPGQPAVIGIAEETRRDSDTPSGMAATAAFNLNIEGNRFDQARDGSGDPVTGVIDRIILPGRF